MSITIRPISAQQLDHLLPALVDLLRETVHGGSPLGFLAPLSHDTARDYWLVVRGDLLAGTRVLVGAFMADRIVGSGQLAFSIYPNARHRAELQKLFVAATLRGQGVGRLLMAGLHDAARERGRSLILLNTRRGGTTEGFYKGLGYKEVGVVPGYSVGVQGERYDTVSFYQELSS
jgi:GNAT superfamily N-acetyltransferase